MTVAASGSVAPSILGSDNNDSVEEMDVSAGSAPAAVVSCGVDIGVVLAGTDGIAELGLAVFVVIGGSMLVGNASKFD